MAVRIKEWEIPYTWWVGIEITDNHVINLLLREENNLIHVNEDNEVYVDLQLEDWIQPNDDFPVGVTTGRILAEDWWQQNGLILNRKTTSWDYTRIIYANDWKLYYDPGTGVWNEFWGGGGWSINVATATSLWVIKLGSNTVQSVAAETPSAVNWKTYAVQLNSDNQAVVNVPWEEYESLPEDQGGQDESLVTTGEKYIRNHKQDALTAGNNITISNGVISANITNVYTYKGSVASQSDLPTTWQQVWDVWLALDTGISYAWNGSSWISMGSTVDLSNYFNKTQDDSDDITEGQSHLFASPAEKSYWNGKQDKLTAGTGITITNNVISWTLYTAWAWINIDVNNVIQNTKPFDPSNAGSLWQVLRKTNTGYEWSNEIAAVTSVNGMTGAVTVSEFSPQNVGSVGQVLKKSSTGYQWANESWGWWGSSYIAGYGIDITNDEISNTLAFDPSNSGSVGQVIKKTNNGYSWQDDAGFEPESTGTTGQVLTKTATGYDWLSSSSNVKAFELDFTNYTSADLQDIVAWVNQGTDYWAIIKQAGWLWDAYLYTYTATSSGTINYYFAGTKYYREVYNAAAWDFSKLGNGRLTISYASGNYTMTWSQFNDVANYLEVENSNYVTPYIPTADYQPATKKYVDDAVSGVTSPVTSVNGRTWAVTVNEVPSSGTTNYVLQKTANGYAWANALANYVQWPASSTDAHLAVFDGATGKIIKDWWAIPAGVPSGGTNGQVLTVVSGNPAWANPTWGSGLQVDSASPIQLTKIRAGTQAQYDNLWSYDGTEAYLVI